MKREGKDFFLLREKKQLWFSRQFSFWNCDAKCLMKIGCVLHSLREQIALLSWNQQQQNETQQVSGLWPLTTSYCKPWQPQQIWEVGRDLFFQLCNHSRCLTRFILSPVRKYHLFYFTLAIILNPGPASLHHILPCTLSKLHHIKNVKFMYLLAHQRRWLGENWLQVNALKEAIKKQFSSIMELLPSAILPAWKAYDEWIAEMSSYYTTV